MKKKLSATAVILATLSFIISTTNDSIEWLPSTAALLKGRLIVIAKGGFAFLNQFLMPRFPAGLRIWNSKHLSINSTSVSSVL